MPAGTTNTSPGASFCVAPPTCVPVWLMPAPRFVRSLSFDVLDAPAGHDRSGAFEDVVDLGHVVVNQGVGLRLHPPEMRHVRLPALDDRRRHLLVDDVAAGAASAFLSASSICALPTNVPTPGPAACARRAHNDQHIEHGRNRMRGSTRGHRNRRTRPPGARTGRLGASGFRPGPRRARAIANFPAPPAPPAYLPPAPLPPAPPALPLVARGLMLVRRESLAGTALSARRHLGRRRRELRALLRARDTRRAVPVRLGRRRTRVRSHRAARADRHGLARLPARRAARASSTATASTGRTSPRNGHRFNPQQGRARPVRQGDRRVRSGGPTSCSATASATPDADLSFDDRDNAAVRAAGRGGRPGLHLGRRSRRRGRRGTRPSSTRCTSRASRKRHPDVPEALRGTYAGARPRSRPSSTCRAWASRPSS